MCVCNYAENLSSFLPINPNKLFDARKKARNYASEAHKEGPDWHPDELTDSLHGQKVDLPGLKMI